MKTIIWIAMLLVFIMPASAITIIGSGSTNTLAITGANGSQGPAGIDGKNGTNGINGLNGSSGSDGAAGSPGINGLNGTVNYTNVALTNNSNVFSTVWNYFSGLNASTINVSNLRVSGESIYALNNFITQSNGGLWFGDYASYDNGIFRDAGGQLHLRSNYIDGATLEPSGNFSVLRMNATHIDTAGLQFTGGRAASFDNKTQISCKNITGAASDLCLINLTEINSTNAQSINSTSANFTNVNITNVLVVPTIRFNDYSPVKIEIWKANSVAPVAGQGLDLPIAGAEMDSLLAGSNASRISMNATEVGNLVQLRFTIKQFIAVVSADINNTINLSIQQIDVGSKNTLIQSTFNFSAIQPNLIGRGNASTITNYTVWTKADTSWFTNNITLALFVSNPFSAAATGDWVFTDVSLYFKNRTVTN